MTEQKDLSIRQKAMVAMVDREKKYFYQLKLMISNGQRFTDDEALALATFAHKEGLDPFIGECWLLKGRDNKVLGPAVGIKGLRKKANEAMPEGEYWFPHYANVTSEYAKEDPDISWAFECTIRYTVASQRYLELYKSAVSEGIPPEKAEQIIGPCPEWKGVGIVRHSEKNAFIDKTFSQRQRAEKRAEAAAIRAWRSLNTYHYAEDERYEEIAEDEQDMIQDGIIDGQFKEESPIDSFVKRIEGQAMIAAGYDQEQPSDGAKGLITAAMEEMVAPGNTAAKRHIILKRIFGKTSSKDLTAYEWSALAFAVKAKKGTNGITWDVETEKVFNAIVEEAKAQDGQDELFGSEIAE